MNKNIIIEFPVLKDHDNNATQTSTLTMSKCDKSNDFKGVFLRLIKL